MIYEETVPVYRGVLCYIGSGHMSLGAEGLG